MRACMTRPRALNRSEARRRSLRSVARSIRPRSISPATARLTATLSMTIRCPTSEAVRGAKRPSAAITRHWVTVRPKGAA